MIAIELRLGGCKIAEVELTQTEFDAVRNMSLRNSIKFLVKKDPKLRRHSFITEHLARNIRTGHFTVTEK